MLVLSSQTTIGLCIDTRWFVCLSAGQFEACVPLPLRGVGQFIKENNPYIQVVLADPQVSAAMWVLSEVVACIWVSGKHPAQLFQFW